MQKPIAKVRKSNNEIDALVNQAHAFEHRGHPVQLEPVMYFALTTARLRQRQLNDLLFTHAGIAFIVITLIGVMTGREHHTGRLSLASCASSIGLPDDLSDRLLHLPLWVGLQEYQDEVILCFNEGVE